jgi:hypothetical protein
MLPPQAVPSQMIPPKVYRSKLCNYSVRFSPFEGNKLALAQSQYFGVVGNGAVQLVQVKILEPISFLG